MLFKMLPFQLFAARACKHAGFSCAAIASLSMAVVSHAQPPVPPTGVSQPSSLQPPDYRVALKSDAPPSMPWTSPVSSGPTSGPSNDPTVDPLATNAQPPEIPLTVQRASDYETELAQYCNPHSMFDCPPPLSAAIPEVPLTLRDALSVALAQNPEIRVLRFDPRAAAQNITITDSVFDPRYGLGLQGGQDDRQLTDALQSFGGIFTTQRRDFVFNPENINDIYLKSRTRIGGEWEVGLGAVYDRFDPVGPLRIVNPAWYSAINFHYEQNLGKGRGRYVNELPIAIATANYRGTSFQVQAVINRILRDVERAYWDVVFAEKRLQQLRRYEQLQKKLYDDEGERMELGTGALPDQLGAEEQYYRIVALAEVAEIELSGARIELRRILGVPLEEQMEFITVTTTGYDRPTDSWDVACFNAMNRPELRAQVAAIRIAGYQLDISRNNTRQDVRAEVDYATQGLEERFDDSLATTGDFNFHRWSAGIFYERALGNRGPRAEVTQSMIRLSQSRAELDRIRQTISAELQDAYQRVSNYGKAVYANGRRRSAAEQRIEAIAELQQAGRATVNLLLLAQLRGIEAELEYIETQLAFARSRVDWDYAQGLLVERWTEPVDIDVIEQPVPMINVPEQVPAGVSP